MAGLDPALVASLNKQRAFGRVLVDVDTDFIYAPHYKLLYEFMQDEIWDHVTHSLTSGTYTPSLLITSEVPKASGLTRPGSILFPEDRVLYQALADKMAEHLDQELDVSRVFSYRILDPDPDNRCFGREGNHTRNTKAR